MFKCLAGLNLNMRTAFTHIKKGSYQNKLQFFNIKKLLNIYRYLVFLDPLLLSTLLHKPLPPLLYSWPSFFVSIVFLSHYLPVSFLLHLFVCMFQILHSHAYLHFLFTFFPYLIGSPISEAVL